MTDQAQTVLREEVVLRPSTSLSINFILPIVVGVVTVTAFFYQNSRDLRQEAETKYQTKEAHRSDIEHLQSMQDERFLSIHKQLDRIEAKLEKL